MNMADTRQPAHSLFVSYAPADRAWVEGYLLDALHEAGVGVLREATFELGAPRLLEFERAMRQSTRTLLVLTPAYLARQINQFVNLLVQSYGLESGTWPVIPLILNDVVLPPRLALLNALDARDPEDWPAVVARLCAAAGAPPPEPAQKPACPYPGMQAYTSAQADFFFGREAEAGRLVEQLAVQPRVVVLGAVRGRQNVTDRGRAGPTPAGQYAVWGWIMACAARTGERAGHGCPVRSSRGAGPGAGKSCGCRAEPTACGAWRRPSPPDRGPAGRTAVGRG